MWNVILVSQQHTVISKYKILLRFCSRWFYPCNEDRRVVQSHTGLQSGSSTAALLGVITGMLSSSVNCPGISSLAKWD